MFILMTLAFTQQDEKSIEHDFPKFGRRITKTDLMETDHGKTQLLPYFWIRIKRSAFVGEHPALDRAE